MQNPIKTIRDYLHSNGSGAGAAMPYEGNEDKSICVVFNVIDHVSILTATILTLFMKKFGNNVIMVDIRDVIPEDCDLYYWIDCGNFEDFMKYYTNGGSRVTSLSKSSKEWIYRLKDISWFVNGAREWNPDSPEQHIMTADFLSGIVVGYLETEETVAAFGLSKSPVLKWLTLEMSALATAKFDSLLAMLHGHYTRGIPMEMAMLVKQLQEVAGADQSVTKFSDLGKTMAVSPSDLCIERYTESQKRAASIITLKARDVNIGGKFFKYTTDLSSLVYSMFRRMTISGNKYIHVSHGAYGTIVYSNSSLEGIIDYVERGSFVLTK